MKRFKNLFLMASAALAALLTAGCGKDAVRTRSGRTEVVFTTVFRTKAAVSSHEDHIASLDLLVFRCDNGQLDAYNRSTGGTAVSGNLSVGVSVRYYVVANAPEGVLSSFADEASFLGAKTLLSQSTASSLLMHGSGSFTVVSGSSAVPVSLDRYVSKVSVQRVEVKWLDSFVTPPSVTLGRVALVNAVGDCPWSGTPEAGSLWFNRMEIEDVDDGTPAMANVGDMLSASYSLPVPDSAPLVLTGSLYAMPNPTSNGVNSATDPLWSPRNTRVAVELLVDGVSNWYPVDLPGMLGNRHYIVTNFAVLGPGADSPDKPVSRSEVEMDVIVQDWEDIDTDIVF